MFSGKSTELVRRVRRFAAAGRKTFIITYKVLKAYLTNQFPRRRVSKDSDVECINAATVQGDTRYGQASHVVTHDKICMKSKAVSTLQEVENEVWQYSVIAVDEAQFLPGKLIQLHQLVIV